MAREVILTVENGPLTGKNYVFKDRQVCVLGRADDCDIWIPASLASMDISRHHCLLDIDPPRVTVRDLGSLNGTWINELPVGWRPGASGKHGKGGIHGEARALQDGDSLRVGQIVFRLHADAAEDGTPVVGEEIRPKQKARVPAQPEERRRRTARLVPPVVENVDLDAWTAADLMTSEVISMPAAATLAEVTATLMANKVSAVLVTDADGHPVGVLSQTDLLAHDCKNKGKAEEKVPAEPETKAAPVVEPAVARAGDLMTPRIFSVPSYTSGSAVVTSLLSLQVHRLFVTDREGNMVGVISRTDVLRRLHSSPSRHQGACRCQLAAALPS
jgi:CBS domain-containing protein